MPNITWMIAFLALTVPQASPPALQSALAANNALAFSAEQTGRPSVRARDLTASCWASLDLRPALLGKRIAESEKKASSAYRIINMVDDFVSYYDECEKSGATGRRAKWDSMLEAKYPEFFRDAIYRKKEGADRDKFKDWCIETFWKEVAPKMPVIRKLNLMAADEIKATLDGFQKQFPDFKPSTDFYLTISFSFRGKVVDVKGKDVFAIGLENFEPGQPQLQITIAHELFHLYHFQFFEASGGLYRTLWAEGLASYASAVVVPGYRFSQYLGFPGEKMNRCQELLPTMTKELLKELENNDQRIKRIYFGAEPNDTPIPPEAGYYVGFMIAESLAKNNSLAELARMKPENVLAVLRQELPRLSESR